jgi:hypothetical protein
LSVRTSRSLILALQIARFAYRLRNESLRKYTKTCFNYIKKNDEVLERNNF